MDADTMRDEAIIESTDWDRIAAHKPAGARAYSMSRAELSKPCERVGCVCPWSAFPAGTKVTVPARNRGGIVREYPEDWTAFPGWVPVEYIGGLSLTRIADLNRT